MFADDIKIYKAIKSLEDNSCMQTNLKRLHEWCESNRIHLNLEKCKLLSFYRGHSPSAYTYHIGDHALDVVSGISDLGVFFDNKLSFVRHIEAITMKATKSLGFIMRTASSFKRIKTFKTLYCSLVRSHLEYCSPIWSPSYAVHQRSIERVQNKFLRFVNYKLNIPIIKLDYQYILSYLDIDKLSVRRLIADLMFLFNILNNRFDSPDLLYIIKFCIPRRSTRQQQLFTEEGIIINNRFNSLMPRLHRLGNEFGTADLFNLTYFLYKLKIRALINSINNY